MLILSLIVTCEIIHRYEIMNSMDAQAIVDNQAILFQFNIFSPSRTPNGSKLKMLIHALKLAPIAK